MNRRILFSIVLLAFAVCAMAQTRSEKVQISVSCVTGESLQGQPVTLVHTDYDLTYENLTLDAQGKCSVMVYPGNHSVTVERDGYDKATKTFAVADGAGTVDVALEITEKTRTPFALQTSYVHNVFTGKNSVSLTWNTELPAFIDDFESYEAFSTSFGQWTGIDGDKLSTAPLTGDYPNRGVQQYAQIINPLTVQPTWWYDYPVLRPYSGKQYVGFIRTNSGDANDDWLISPVITPGTDNILAFMAKAADVYTERFRVYVTTKTDNPQVSDFIRLDGGNYEAADYKGWKEYVYDLSQYAGKEIKFAIRYISNASAYGAFMLMLDDVYVGPDSGTSYAKSRKAIRVSRKSPANPNEEFLISINGEQVGSTSEYSYSFPALDGGDYTFGVKAKYISAVSEEVTTSLKIPTDAYSRLTFNVSANSYTSVDGTQVSILNAETGDTCSVTIADGKAEILSLPKGRYIINIASGAFEKYEKEISLSADQTLNIELADNVVTPYNITAETDDDTSGVILSWNQILQFKDSFEDYDDFATGSFGDWKTIDADKMPVYPIALGSQTNIVTFPGSGTPQDPQAIAPMVFNPYMTAPAMMPSDPAVAAVTGDKSVIFFSPQQAKADKWLISPEIAIHDDYEFSIAAKSYSDYYPETLEFCVSTDGDQPENFTAISQAEKMPSDQWTLYTTSLAAYAGKTVRIGIHYVSYDTFFAQVDDFTVGAADGAKTFIDYGNIDHFNIYLDNVKVAETESSSYTFTGLSSGAHVAGIQAVYKNATSEIAEYTFSVGTGISQIENGENSLPINERARVSLFNLAGQRLDASRHQQGIYILKSGNKVVKVKK